MKKLHSLKLIAIAILSVAMITGCSQPQKEEKPAAPEVKASTQAIADAEAAIKKAKALNWIWRDTEKFLKKAKKAAKAGNEAEAVKNANIARKQAEDAVKQYYAEQGIDRSVQPAGGVSTYTVAKGDSLWRISGKDEVYGDPYRWPLIYKANSAKIKDADLIYPGQDLDVNTAATSEEVDAAVRHAKTRGAWTIGVAEESDKAYLGK